MSGYRRVAALAELWTGDMSGYVVDGTKVVLVRLEDGVRAYEDRCAHLGFPLSRGRLEDGVLTCTAHHFTYDARTGCGINPKSACLKEFAVSIAGGDVLVEIDR
jgi:toluene monooxygenase system ferredoxin subunit